MFTGCAPVLSVELKECGLTEDLLLTALTLCSDSREVPVDVRWSLKGIPHVGFYRELQKFLKRLALSCGFTKITIGQFYVSIDPELRQKRMSNRPDNVYQFIERMLHLISPALPKCIMVSMN